MPPILTCESYSTKRLFVAWVLAMAFSMMGLAAQAQIAVTSFANTVVGQQTGPLLVSVTINIGGTAVAPLVVTQGGDNLDFKLAGGGSCTTMAYSALQQCTVGVTFTPQFPGLRSGAVVLTNSTGTVLGITYLTGMATGSLSVLVPGRIDTVAGNINWIYSGDGVLATSASIFLPTGVVTDAAGNLYISDSSNNRIRRVDAATQNISTIAGTGAPGYSGDGGLAKLAMISNPAGIAIDGAGNLYFADWGNHVIRRIDANSGLISTVVGTPGAQGYTGDAGLATAASLSLPEGLAFDSAQNLYIADTGNNVIRKVSAATGKISTVAGSSSGNAGFSGDGGAATAALLNAPWSLTVAADGSLYIADRGNNVIRKVDTGGTISRVAGTGSSGFSGDGGVATAAQLDVPASVVFDPAGNMYIADSGNNRVRKINASTNIIQTIVGTAGEQFAGDAGPANLASLYGPYALDLDQAGNLLIADMFHNRIRRIRAGAILLAYDSMRVGKLSDPQPEGLENDGNAGLNFVAPTLTNAALDVATTTCKTSVVLSSGSMCMLGVEFAPTVVGNPVSGSALINSDAANTPAVISLTGEVLSVEPTTVGLASSKNPSLTGDTVTFTATVSSASPTLTGTVIFLDGATQICSVSLGAGRTATCNTSTLALGSHAITASYSGDAQDASSVSSQLTQVVKQAVTLTLGVTPNPAVVTNSVTLTVTATAATGTPTGNITFYDGTTSIGTTALDVSGVATFTTSALTAATHNLKAKYNGDTTNGAAQSNIVTEVVNLATTNVTLGSNNANVNVGTSVTFTAIVSSTNGPLPTGLVQFTDGVTNLGPGTLDGTGQAILTLSTLASGVHQILATYSGDNDNATSFSAKLAETVVQIPTTIAVVSDTNPASAGATIHLIANVAMGSGATAYGTITGTVTFSDGSTTLGTAAVNLSGQATLAVNWLSAGTHILVASYGGNTNYAASTSLTLPEQITTTATTTTLTTSTPSSLAGKPVTFTITVGSTTSIPTGTVTIRDGSNTLGLASLNAQGIATFTTSTLSLGTLSLTATYNGDGNYVTSTSNSLQEVVSLGTTVLTLAGPTAPVDAGTLVTVAATLTTNGLAPAGALTLRDGGNVIATQMIVSTGSFPFSTATLSVGTHTLTAAYAGDSNNASALSPAITVIVQQASTVTTLSSSANPSGLGQIITFSSSVTSNSPSIGGSISFMDGTTLLGSAPMLGGVVSITTSTLSFGVHNLTAVYSGDTNHATSTSSVISEQIIQSPTVAITSSLNPLIAGKSVTFTATATGVGSLVPTGNVIFKDGSTTLGIVALDASGKASFQTSSLAVGSRTISASYTGDQSYSGASASLIQTVVSADTQIALAASTNLSTYSTPLSLTATISTNGVTATGSVVFTDGSATIGSAVLNASGVATLTLSTLAPGTHSIVANYAGDGKASASVSVPYALTVKEATSVALTTSASTTQTLTPIVFTAAVINGGVGVATGLVTFTDGATQLGTAMLDGTGKATLTVPALTTGSHTILASYAGDNNDFISVSAGLIETVQLRPTTTILTASPTDPMNLLQVTLIAVVRWSGTVSPTGTLTFSIAGNPIGSSPVDSTGVATLTIILQNSPENITASYSGDSFYSASLSMDTTVTAGIATRFALSMDPSSVSMQSKQHQTVNLTIVSVKAFTDTLQLGCLGLPYAATCTFSSTQTTLAANGSTSVQLIVDTGNPLGAGSQASIRSLKTSHMALCFLPGTFLAGLLFLRKRRRPLLALLLMLCAVTVTLGVSGCSGLQMNGTPPGTYTFKVSASGLQTGVTETQVMTMTVTE